MGSKSVLLRTLVAASSAKTAAFGVLSFVPKEVARPKRFELLTPRFVVWCSIQLSYGRLLCRSRTGKRGPQRLDPALARAGSRVQEDRSAGSFGVPAGAPEMNTTLCIAQICAIHYDYRAGIEEIGSQAGGARLLRSQSWQG